MPKEITTAQQVKVAFEMTVAVADAIKQLGSVPSGHLYARLMGTLTLDQYQKIIDLLIRNDLISQENHLLTWK